MLLMIFVEKKKREFLSLVYLNGFCFITVFWKKSPQVYIFISSRVDVGSLISNFKVFGAFISVSETEIPFQNV